MTWISGLVAYVIIWWLVLFAVLPWGNRPPERPEEGHVASAPANPRLGLKFVVTSAIAGVLFLIVWGLVESGWISFREP